MLRTCAAVTALRCSSARCGTCALPKGCWLWRSGSRSLGQATARRLPPPLIFHHVFLNAFNSCIIFFFHFAHANDTLRGLKIGVVNRPMYSVSFIMSPSTAAVSHTERPSAGTSSDDCRALGRHKGDVLQNYYYY